MHINISNTAIKSIFVATVMLGLSACTSNFHHGYTTYQIEQQTCDAMIYWHDTSHWYSSKPEKSAIVIKQASSHRAFILPYHKNQVSPLVLPNDLYKQEAFVKTLKNHNILTKQDPTKLNCGFVEPSTIEGMQGEQIVKFHFYCNALAHPIKQKPAIMPAQSVAYLFEMQPMQSNFSWLGEHQPVDAKLTCRPSQP